MTGCVWCGTFTGVDKETDQGRMCGQCAAAYLSVHVLVLAET